MTVTILNGDALEQLRTLPDKSVHCVVTSPPYWGLRDYQTGRWEGGDPACSHVRLKRGQASTIDGGHYQSREIYASICRKCGAARIDQQIGIEETVGEYVERLVGVFREVGRVLRDDGTLWLNLGDSYAGSWGAEGRRETAAQPGWKGSIENHPKMARSTKAFREAGLKPKDLVGVPWRVAFALQDDGWYLRQDIIWSKPNPMPESVTDRCTKAHEYLFLFSRNETYHFDAEAIAEDAAFPRGPGNIGPTPNPPGERDGDNANLRGSLHKIGPRERRNKRSVWTVATQPFKEAHFATFPPALIEPCILAGRPKGGVVLDPFGGAGTTGVVGNQHGRDVILIELNPKYAAMADRRIHGTLFAGAAS